MGSAPLWTAGARHVVEGIYAWPVREARNAVRFGPPPTRRLAAFHPLFAIQIASKAAPAFAARSEARLDPPRPRPCRATTPRSWRWRPSPPPRAPAPAAACSRPRRTPRRRRRRSSSSQLRAGQLPRAAAARAPPGARRRPSLSPSFPAPSRPPPPPPQPTTTSECIAFNETNYSGAVIAFLYDVPSAEACCSACSATSGCNIYVYCPRAGGCDDGTGCECGVALDQTVWKKENQIQNKATNQ